MSQQKSPILVPPSTIGILGGGQLGRMLAIAGRNMGYRFITLDPTPNSPCGQAADGQIIATYDDVEAARELAKQSDIITYEFENVDAKVAALLESESYVPQGSRLLYTTQHRLREKKAIVAAGAPVAPYREIGSLDDLQQAVAELGLPSVLKTATGGYDGKGQFVIRRPEQVEEAFQALEPAKTELVLEQFIRFEKEVSVIAARNPDGQVKTFPVAENIHIDNILHVSIVPARIAKDVASRAEKLAKSIAETLNVVGLIAVELFVTADGELYVNELAPRPHNSGHYTMEACRTSQFEQHLRAICNLPLGDTSLMQPVVMVNLLGQHVTPTLAWMQTEDATAVGMTAKVHLYGKEEAKAQRKMGHINLLTEDLERTLNWIESSPIWRDIYEGRN